MLALLLESDYCVVVCQKMSSLTDPVLIKEACSKTDRRVEEAHPTLLDMRYKVGFCHALAKPKSQILMKGGF